MKKTRFFLLAMLATLVASTFAGNVNMQTAHTAACNFMRSRGVTSEIQSVDFAERSEFPNLYVFGNEHCFVIIAGDDAVHPVLGYSTECGINAEPMPEAVYDWLKAYDKGIAFAKEKHIEKEREIQSEWESLLNGRGLEPKVRSRVEPLIKSRWQYGTPFNNLCPADTAGPGGHAKTGCGAVTMAQLMNYWEHPVRGTGSFSYTPSSHPEYGTQTVNFGNTVYDWDHMRNVYQKSYSDIEAEAVATLMYHCGVSVRMDYGPDASGTSTSRIDDALIEYFNYNNSMSYKEKDGHYSDAQWIAMLKNDLNVERPVIYRGQSQNNSVGHIFVCDGYDENDYFHFNLGYAGRWDGYYAIGSLYGGANYSYVNRAIFGIFPNQTSINPPTNVSTAVNGRNVSITWNSVSNASSYKVYRDGDLIVSNVTNSSFTDANAPYGEHGYYVKSVKSDGTMSLKSNTSVVDVHFSGPVPANLQASVNGNDVNLSWTSMNPESAVLQYGINNNNPRSVGGVGNGFYWAQRFSTTAISDYAGMAVQKVAYYFTKTGTYLVSIYKGDEANPRELVYQQLYYASSVNAWQDIIFTNPVPIDYTKDLWVVYYADNSITRPASFCYYSGSDMVDAVLYSSVADGTIWKEFVYVDNDNESHNCSWLMKTYLTDGTYTYNLYRDGNVVANNLTGNTYTDANLADGFYDYHVTTNYFGGESDPSNTVHVQVGNPTYTISTLADPTNGGSVTGAGTYNYGQTCTLTATPATGYNFVNWTKNGTQVSTNANYSFTVIEAASYVAHFQIQSYAISASANPSNGGSVSGGGTYNYGQTCTLTATPAAGYNFVNWTKDGTQVSTNANYSFTVTEAASYVAHFQIQSYTISASANPSNGGSVSGGGTYNYGETCTLTATAANGYNFLNWTESGSMVSSNASYSFTVNANRSLVANFSLDNFVVSVSADPSNGGSVTGGGAFHYGDNCTVVATANPGYNFVNWTENGTQVSSSPNYSFTVTDNRTLVVHFTSQSYVITATADPEEGGTITGMGGYNYGETCHLTATANAGFEFSNWTKNGNVVSTNPSYSFTVTESANYVAHFTVQSYTVNVSANPSEGGSVSGGGTFSHGQTCTVHVTPNSCYRFVSWTESSNVVSTQADYSFTVTGNRNLVANFALETYTVTVDIEPGEGGTVIGAGVYPCGESVTLTAIPNDNYAFVGWFKDGNLVSANPTMVIVAGDNHHFTARFAIIEGVGENDGLVEVYPNPANDVLYVVGDGIKKVTVFNALGQVVEDVEAKWRTDLRINLQHYKAGIYLIQVETLEGTLSKQFVKQ